MKTETEIPTPRTAARTYLAGSLALSAEVVPAEDVRQLERELASKQAKIDSLMLEHCPDEMTAEQIKEWGSNQVPSPEPATPAPTMSAEQGKGTVHELKCWPAFFQAVKDGSKTFEIRHNDRGFKVGDTLHLREWDRHSGTYSGDDLRRKITYITEHGQLPGHVVMGLSAPAPAVGEAYDKLYKTAVDGLSSISKALDMPQDVASGAPEIVHAILELRRELRRYENAHAVLTAMAQQRWLTIESAPKDQTTVLVAYRNSHGKWRRSLARYYPEGTLEMSDDFDTDDGYADEGWYEVAHNRETWFPLESEPEIWQPLPPPPEEVSNV